MKINIQCFVVSCALNDPWTAECKHPFTLTMEMKTIDLFGKKKLPVCTGFKQRKKEITLKPR